MNPPKIALVANTAWNLHHFRRPLVRRLLADGYEVLLIAAPDEHIEALHDMKGARFLPLRHLHPRSAVPWREVRLLAELYRLYRRERPALVLHFTIKPNLYGSLVAGRLGLRNIATITGLGYTFLNDTWRRRLLRPLYRLAFRNCSRIVCQNPDDRQWFLQNSLAEASRISLIPGSGVDTAYFQPREKQDPTAPFIFLFIGRLLYDKGLGEFCEAARQLRTSGAAFRVLGERQPDHPNGVPDKVLQEWIDEGVIEYLGYREDVRDVLAQADVLVLPSYREGLPRSVLEAMSMAKPILATDAPGCRQTVEPGKNGFLTPVRSVPALVRAMVQLLKLDPTTLMEMGQYSRRKVEAEFSEEAVVEAYMDLIGAVRESTSR